MACSLSALLNLGIIIIIITMIIIIIISFYQCAGTAAIRPSTGSAHGRKDRFQPKTDHESPEGIKGVAVLFLYPWR